MAYLTGKYAADLAANTLTEITTAGGLGATEAGTYFLNFCNRTGVATSVSFAVTTGGTVTNADYIEFNAVLTANGVLARWPIAMQSGWRAFASAAAAGVSVNLISLKDAQ